ncbi:hypothetical protein [Priestia megaterium]|uniref:hypothetical protein n=1 Tax=Priestia megaterium TaxID=1404 RepID=UPI00189C9799|nr:hypothetical protein [Priestia megaterium]
MLQRIIRSPFIPMSMFLLIILCFTISTMDFYPNQSMLARMVFLSLIVITLCWTILAQLHNRKYPHDRINSLGLIPPEFQETDEGQQWITFKACRNVYVYYTYALPIVAGICFLFSTSRFIPLLSIGALGLGQYIVYWLTIRKLNQF